MPNTDIYKLLTSDVMHTATSGVFPRLLELSLTAIRALKGETKILDKINERFRNMRAMPDMKRYKNGICTPGAFGAELHAKTPAYEFKQISQVL